MSNDSIDFSELDNQHVGTCGLTARHILKILGYIDHGMSLERQFVISGCKIWSERSRPRWSRCPILERCWITPTVIVVAQLITRLLFFISPTRHGESPL